MKTSEKTQEIFSALIKARADIKNLYPAAAGYGYSYIPLQDVIDHLTDVLPKNGLGYVQLPTGGDAVTVGLSTRIIHESGQWVQSEALFPLTDMKGVNKSQAAGAAVTYFRRYALTAAFGITGDKDVDASDRAIGKVAKDYTVEIAAINGCKDAESLIETFTQIYKKTGAVPELVAAKDAKKKELGL